MIIDKIGWYKTRGGKLAYVGMIFPEDIEQEYPVVGYTEAEHCWDLDGLFVTGTTDDSDLVEFIGPDKPKQKRMVEKTIDCFVNVYPPTSDIEKYSYVISTNKTASKIRAASDFCLHKAVPAKLTFSIEEEVDE